LRGFRFSAKLERQFGEFGDPSIDLSIGASVARLGAELEVAQAVDFKFGLIGAPFSRSLTFSRHLPVSRSRLFRGSWLMSLSSAAHLPLCWHFVSHLVSRRASRRWHHT